MIFHLLSWYFFGVSGFRSRIPIFSFHFHGFHSFFRIFGSFIYFFAVVNEKWSCEKAKMAEKSIHVPWSSLGSVQFSSTLADWSGAIMSLVQCAAKLETPLCELSARACWFRSFTFRLINMIPSRNPTMQNRNNKAKRETRSSNRFSESAINTVCALIQLIHWLLRIETS